MKTGHVERTNDRDYEVEERYAGTNRMRIQTIDVFVGDTERWKRQPTDYRKKQKATSTVSEVMSPTAAVHSYR